MVIGVLELQARRRDGRLIVSQDIAAALIVGLTHLVGVLDRDDLVFHVVGLEVVSEIELSSGPSIGAHGGAIELEGAVDAKRLPHQEALAIVEQDTCEFEAQRGVAAHRPSGAAREEVNLSRLECSETFLRRGPVVRQGDDAWFNVVKWTRFGLLDAEEAGITQANVEQMKASTNPEIQRMLGVKNSDGSAAGFGTGIGLNEEWLVQIVKAVGNYGEIFDRNVGPKTPLKMTRGKNALWRDGGLQYAPPIR